MILNSKSKLKFLNWLFPIVVVSIIIFFAFVSSNSHKKFNNYLLIKRENAVNLKVVKIRSSNNAEFHFSSSEGKLHTLSWADNMAYKRKHLCRFIQRGDSICKLANSDSLFIYRNGERFHFVLKKRIWQ